jgi:hypothetical protein
VSDVPKVQKARLSAPSRQLTLTAASGRTRRVAEDVEWDGPSEEIPNHSEGTETLCADVDWPAQHTWAFRQYRRGYTGR